MRIKLTAPHRPGEHQLSSPFRATLLHRAVVIAPASARVTRWSASPVSGALRTPRTERWSASVLIGQQPLGRSLDLALKDF